MQNPLSKDRSVLFWNLRKLCFNSSPPTGCPSFSDDCYSIIFMKLYLFEYWVIFLVWIFEFTICIPREATDDAKQQLQTDFKKLNTKINHNIYR